MNGKFITFEGSEGSGKSTHSKRLYAYLKRKGLPVLHIREPGGTKVGEQIRKILLDPAHKMMSPVCETLLYMAARRELVESIIRPALKEKKIVICDRFLDSTRAYQGFGLGVDMKLIECVGLAATTGIAPDLTIFLDLAAKAGLKRTGAVKDRIEKRPLSYHQRVRQGYLKLAQREPKRIKIIKVAKNKLVTQARIREIVRNFIDR
jgi:dTMP kinase